MSWRFHRLQFRKFVVRVSSRSSAPLRHVFYSVDTSIYGWRSESKTLILMLLAPLSNKPFVCKLKYFLDKSTASTVSSSFTVSRNKFILQRWRTSFTMRSTKLAVFQAHKLFFDNIYWSYSFCRIVGVFYLDFNRHDTQIDKTTRRFPDRTISSLPSNATKSVHRDNECDNWRH